MSPLGAKLFAQGSRDLAEEVRRLAEREQLEAYVETVKRVMLAKAMQHIPEVVVARSWADDFTNYAEDAARNIVAALQPDLCAPPREAVGLDFDTPLISGRGK